MNATKSMNSFTDKLLIYALNGAVKIVSIRLRSENVEYDKETPDVFKKISGSFC